MTMNILILLVSLVCFLSGIQAVADGPATMYIGYGNNNTYRIALYDLNTDGATGGNSYKKRDDDITTGEWPYSMIMDKPGNRIYTLEKNNDSDASFNISFYARDSITGKFVKKTTTYTNNDLYYLAFDDTEKYIATADFAQGSVQLFSSDTDGFLKKEDSIIIPGAETKSYPYLANFVPNQQNLVGVAYAGLDAVAFLQLDASYKFDTQKTPIKAVTDKGSFPVTFVFFKDKMLYVLGLKTATVTVFEVTKKVETSEIDGFIQKQKIPSLPANETGGIEDFDYNIDIGGDARLELHPNGKFLYAMHIWQQYIATYSIDKDGMLSLVEFKPIEEDSDFAFGLAITPDGTRMIVSNENNVVIVYNIGGDGKLALSETIKDLNDPGFIIYR